MLEDEQSPNAKLMPKNGVQQMIKRPVTTATVIEIRVGYEMDMRCVGTLRNNDGDGNGNGNCSVKNQ